uniref:C2H2-type domain-containing protein n=1 Tax=Ornithodoros turicata TaxID=34597 RepID=A0A2R5L687_9ACAR
MKQQEKLNACKAEKNVAIRKRRNVPSTEETAKKRAKYPAMEEELAAWIAEERKQGNIMNSPFACKVCQKTFTGPEPYQQHLASERHKKKCTSAVPFENLTWKPHSANVSAGATSMQQSHGLCCISCCVHFKSVREALAHYESEDHRKRKTIALQPVQQTKPKIVEATQTPMLGIKPILPGSILVCQADEDFTEFCKRHGL